MKLPSSVSEGRPHRLPLSSSTVCCAENQERKWGLVCFDTFSPDDAVENKYGTFPCAELPSAPFRIWLDSDLFFTSVFTLLVTQRSQSQQSGCFPFKWEILHALSHSSHWPTGPADFQFDPGSYVESTQTLRFGCHQSLNFPLGQTLLAQPWINSVSSHFIIIFPTPHLRLRILKLRQAWNQAETSPWSCDGPTWKRFPQRLKHWNFPVCSEVLLFREVNF